MKKEETVHRKLVKSAMGIGLGTLLSRFLGLIRDIFIAKFFGTTLFADSFFAAFRIPNLFRDFIGEGAANSAFVPVFSEYLVRKEYEEYQKLANALFKVIILILLGITILGILFSPFIVSIIAPGFKVDFHKYQTTVNLTRIVFPYIFFTALTAFFMGILHTHRIFVPSALSPCMLNISLIIGAFYWTKYLAVYSLAWAVILGGILQVLIHIPSLKKVGFKPNLIGAIKHPGLNKILKLLIPRVLGSCIYQMNLFVDTILASLSKIVGEGGISALYYSNRILQLPLAIFGISLAQAALPTMSIQSQENSFDKLSQTISFSLRGIFFITLPSAIGLMVLAEPITRVLFQRGEFEVYSTQITSSALFFYSLGLFAYAGIKILVSAFYSLQDTLTPVRTSGISLIINIILNLILMFPLKISGLALATAISATLNFCLLYRKIRKKINIDIKGIVSSLIRIFLASLSMGILVKISFYNLKNLFPKEFIPLIGVIFLGVIFYIFLSSLFGVKELSQVKRWILKKK